MTRSGEDDMIRYMFLTVCLGCADSGVIVSQGSSRVECVICDGCEDSLVFNYVCLSLTSLRFRLSLVYRLLAECISYADSIPFLHNLALRYSVAAAN